MAKNTKNDCPFKKLNGKCTKKGSLRNMSKLPTCPFNDKNDCHLYNLWVKQRKEIVEPLKCESKPNKLWGVLKKC
jgi:hypothetical protein